MYKGTLEHVLNKIGEQLSLPADSLIEYAAQAPYAETRPDGNTWPSGTGSISEKRILYAITRAMNPMLSLDLGTRWGAMALQMATGDKDAPHPFCRVISVDVETHIHGSKTKVGKFIPKQLWLDLVNSDAVQYLKDDNKYYEIIFEDTEHTFEMTKSIYELAPDRLVVGGVIISHDACHPKFRGAVVDGITATGINPNVYLVEGDSCGLAIWQKPSKTERIITELEQQIHNPSAFAQLPDSAKDDNEAPQEKPKRRKRRRKKASKIVEPEVAG